MGEVQGSKCFKPWLLRPYFFKPITVPREDQRNMLVSELLMESGGWDWNKVNNVLWEVDRWEVNRLLGGSEFGEINWFGIIHLKAFIQFVRVIMWHRRGRNPVVMVRSVGSKQDSKNCGISGCQINQNTSLALAF